ncbi:MAG: hypothetical protein OHK0038_24680 [Flammeovirgaceae bacterium]
MVSMLPNRNVLELGRLPFLFEHFSYHQQKEAIGFVEFLSLHYANSQHHLEDHEQHQKLPFDHERVLNFHILHHFAFFPILSIMFKSVFHFQTTLKFHLFSISFVSRLFANVWQPPKIA